MKARGNRLSAGTTDENRPDSIRQNERSKKECFVFPLSRDHVISLSRPAMPGGMPPRLADDKGDDKADDKGEREKES